MRGQRERYELADMILIRQPDEKRTIQISRAAGTYLITADKVAAAGEPAATAASTPQNTSGAVIVETSYVDTGERKTAFSFEARRIKTSINRQPQAGACDGDPLLLGFPIGYTTTVTEGDDKPTVMSMEITAFEVANLDAGLFEIPEGMAAAADAHELAKRISDAHEAKLATGTPLAVGVHEKKPGTIRVGVPELGNKTTNDVDTRALRTRLIAGLAEEHLDAVPLAAAAQSDVELYAKEFGCDYLLMAEVVELKASAGGRLSRMVKSTAGVGMFVMQQAMSGAGDVPGRVPPSMPRWTRRYRMRRAKSGTT